MRSLFSCKTLLAAGLCLPALFSWADDESKAAPGADFAKDIHPFFEQYCFDCHDSGTAKGDINLEQFDSADAFWKNPKIWERVLVQLQDKVMPPAKKKQPSDDDRTRLAAWVAANLDHPDLGKLPHDPGRTIIHRLSRAEYDNTIRDLLGVDTHPADDFPPDGGGGGGFDNNASTLYVPPVLMEKYFAAAGAVLSAAKPERLFTTPPAEGRDEREAARLNLTDLARRAFRRPNSTAEVDRLLGLYDAARKRGESAADAFKLAAKAILVSPHFLFRVEAEQSGATEAYRITDFELASRLSYFLWLSMPDEELFRLASENKLHDASTLDAQVRRMLADPKAQAFCESFASQWLRTKELQGSVAPAPDKFPEYTPALRDAFYAESVDFFAALLHDNLPLSDCLGCDYTYANETLAKFYGIPDVQGSEMRRVKLADTNRGGILGMGGVLALTSYPRRTSPVLRGKWVMEEILGTPPPPPPPEVNTEKVGSDRVKDGLTFRQRMEQHRADPKCAGCHARMDPLGFGLENFDAVGGWRTEVSGSPVDASGQLVTGQKFTGPAELKQLLLARKGEFIRTLTEKMLSFALGRGLEPSDWWTVHQTSRAVLADDCHAQTLIIEIVRSFPFQYRRPAAPPSVAAVSP